ncbi:MAG: hypothetical protein EA356_13945 [Geminicoccaceae bacterium]|nr:MAG: hypothetical protein EA356_13945 [Geminicoccaceae bacterium]
MSEAPCDDHDLLQALPQLSADDLIPEITSLRLDPLGRLQHVERRQPLIVTYSLAGRRVTGRLSFGGDLHFEVGCRLARIPYSIEAPHYRRMLLATIERIHRAKVGHLGLTPRQELHLRAVIDLGKGPLGSADLLHALVVVGLGLRPVFRWLDAIPLPPPRGEHGTTGT